MNDFWLNYLHMFLLAQGDGSAPSSDRKWVTRWFGIKDQPLRKSLIVAASHWWHEMTAGNQGADTDYPQLGGWSCSFPGVESYRNHKSFKIAMKASMNPGTNCLQFAQQSLPRTKIGAQTHPARRSSHSTTAPGPPLHSFHCRAMAATAGFAQMGLQAVRAQAVGGCRRLCWGRLWFRADSGWLRIPILS